MNSIFSIFVLYTNLYTRTMSKLSNAPLVEVIFEIRWNSTNKQEVDKFQLLIGAMYAALKDTYEKPENFITDANIPIQAFLNRPIYRARKKDGTPILYQLGPGVLSINYVGPNYDWSSFYSEISMIVNQVKELYSFSPSKDIQISLKYLDFFDFQFGSENIFTFLKDKFHLNIESEFIKDPMGVKLEIAQKEENDSIFNIKINTGTLNDRRQGFVVESKLQSVKKTETLFPKFDDILTEFHYKLSSFFKNMTKGELYESFNKQ